MQLEPIIRGQQFFAPCQLALRGLDSDVQLWELFRVAELTQVMRQEDGWMLHALNRMRIGEHTAEDNARWKGLERDAPAHLPMHCCTNERVVQHNKRVYNASPEQPACFAAQALTPNSKSEALTFFKQEANTVRENYSRAMYKSGGLFLLYLKVGMMVEYTVNNQQGDGLVNGADGILKAVTRTYEPRQTHGVEVYDVAWVLFTDPRVGQVRRRNQKRFLPVGETTFIDPDWTPIPREQLYLRRDRRTAEVLQLPLLPANARTHDRSQGMDLQAAVIDLTPPKRQQKREGLHYMALSRAKTPEGTYIVPGTYNPDDICVSRAALAAVEKAKRERPATIPYPIRGAPDQITLVAHNTASLRSHREIAAHWLCMPERRHGPSPVDLICASETNCADSDISDIMQGEFSEFSAVVQGHHNHTHPHHKNGSVALAHAHIANNITETGSICEHGCEILFVDLVFPHTNLRVVHVYRSPSVGSMPLVLDSLSRLLPHKPWIVCGDLNINMLSKEPHGHHISLASLMSSRRGRLIHSGPSTIMGSQLDHMWTNCPDMVTAQGQMWAPFSDHFLLWATLRVP